MTIRKPLDFYPASHPPAQSGDDFESAVLLLNPCDGYHEAYARFDDAGRFMGMFNFTGSNAYQPDEFYIAWAKLPDSLELSRQFRKD